MRLNGLDLFSGIGGLSIALKPWVRTVAYCERDRYAQAVLLSRMHSNDIDRAPIWDDVTSLRGAMLPSIDMVFGKWKEKREPRVRWLNEYPNGFGEQSFISKESADKNACNDRIACVRFIEVIDEA